MENACYNLFILVSIYFFLETKMSIGERIKRLRIQTGMSQAELAALCAWTDIKFSGKAYDNGQLRISCYERSAATIPSDKLIILAKALKTSVGYLATGRYENNKDKILDKEK